MARRTLDDGGQHTVSRDPVYNIHCLLASIADDLPASVVPYQGFKTADGDIFIGGANDKLFRILADKLGKPEWKTDAKYSTNNDRVKNRKELESLIEAETTKKTTKEWLDILEGSGMPYAAVNDVMGTFNHEHSKSIHKSFRRNHVLLRRKGATKENPY